MYDLKLFRKVHKLCQLSANQQLTAPHHTQPHDGPQYVGFQPISDAAVLDTVALSWGCNGWGMAFITHTNQC